jgi:alpha 1,3-glucosidase
MGLLLWTVVVMAVDRTKFRTCQQASFCRRNRQHADGTPHNSHLLYQYKLIPESVHFHIPEHAASVQKEPDSVWTLMRRKLLGAAVSEYVAGPPPTLTGTLQNTAADAEFLQFSITTLVDGTARLRFTEVYGGSPALMTPRVTYDDLVLHQPHEWKVAHEAVWWRSSDEAFQSFLQRVKEHDSVENYMALQYKTQANTLVLLLQLEPFQLTLYRDDVPIVQLNGKDLMHFEVRRMRGENQPQEEVLPKDEEPKEKSQEKEIVGYWEDGLAIYADGTREEREEIKEEAVEEEDHRQLTEEQTLDPEGLWEETFSSHKDSKPFGPMSVGMDISFPGSKHLYGIPEHASSAVLKATRGEGSHYKEPYRLYNLDVFEYELDETMALYGAIPFMLSQSKTAGSVGVFWFNPSETFVDITSTDSSSTAHWISESGVIDLFLLPGPDPSSIYQQYAKLTGTTPLPPMFSLGYHQCRWNYKDEKDVYYVHEKFEELDYPYDVLWLDIEHTDGKRYFTWDKGLFPHPEEMQEKLASQGRRMVTIIDPHIKRDKKYYIHKEAESKGLYIKDKDGQKDFDGWCWPGSSSYLDFTAEHVRSWWADQFAYNRYVGSTPTLFTWNDMNEPSVFNGPEVSMSKDLKNLKGEEHREWHNLYGMLFHRATSEGLIRRNQPDEDIRPFVLSRSFFAGSQKYGAIWTGDNAAQWGHLEVAAPMLLSMNVAALTFVGADVGGFFGDPDPELFTRWMQAGAYTPFFRGHAHHDSKRREPWVFGDEVLHRLRKAAMARYALLPFWYTLFRFSEDSGMPILRMMWMEYPQLEELYSVEDQYFVGNSLLVKPITAPGVTKTSVSFPSCDSWYDAETLALVVSATSGECTVHVQEVSADLDTIPVFQRGGSILPRKLRLRRSSMLMKNDPYTLYVALDSHGMATGGLHMDDEESFGYRTRSEFATATFSADLEGAKTLSNTVTIGSGWENKVDDMLKDRMIERIVIMGVSASPAKVTVQGRVVEYSFSEQSNLLVLRKPQVSALSNWNIMFEQMEVS